MTHHLLACGLRHNCRHFFFTFLAGDIERQNIFNNFFFYVDYYGNG